MASTQKIMFIGDSPPTCYQEVYAWVDTFNRQVKVFNNGNWAVDNTLQDVIFPTTGTGAKGSMGPMGIDGSDGEDGLDGMWGAAGTQGVKGDPGDPGTPGGKGDTGAQGFMGVPGFDGEDGQDGFPIVGPVGAKGSAIPGYPGQDGQDGDDVWAFPQTLDGLGGRPKTLLGDNAAPLSDMMIPDGYTLIVPEQLTLIAGCTLLCSVGSVLQIGTSPQVILACTDRFPTANTNIPDGNCYTVYSSLQ